MDDTTDMRLAVYGTLAPGRVNHGQLAGLRGTWERGTVRGTRLPEGWGSDPEAPGLVLDPGGGEVEVDLFRSADLPAHWPDLDAFEGDEYRRVVVQVHLTGGSLPAYVYVAASAPTA